jgi:hypothetical protein
MELIKTTFKDLGRFLTFRATAEDYDRFGLPHFVVGFIFTWLVGIARNWDFPTAPLFAQLGLASIAYIFFMSGILFIVGWGPSFTRQNYWKVLTVVAMTAPPGLVYGIPVEQWMSIGAAQQTNLIFLGIVAVWRVALALHFFTVAAENPVGMAITIIFLPVTLIIIGLFLTGRVEYVLDIMGGLRNKEPGSNDAVNQVLVLLYFLSYPGAVVGLLAYFSAWYNNMRD